MGKAKYKHYPRTIIQKRKDHPSTLTTTIPKQIVSQLALKAGDILEFVVMTEGSEWQQIYVKLRKAPE